MALEPSGEFEFEQHGAHDRRRGAGHPDEIVEQNGRWSEQIDDARAIAGIGFGSERLVVGLAQRKSAAP